MMTENEVKNEAKNYDTKSIEELVVNLNDKNKSPYHAIILKFGAAWCGPCQNIKDISKQNFEELQSIGAFCLDVDIDKNLDLYAFLKRKKMIQGIPIIMAYIQGMPRDDEKWFIADDTIKGGDIKMVQSFYNRCKRKIIKAKEKIKEE